MTSHLAAVVSEIANALQVAGPAAERMRERERAQADDADALAAALRRAADALHLLQGGGV